MLTGLLFGQDSLITEKNKTIIQLQVKADAKEDFDTKLIWSGASIVEIVGATTSRWLYDYKQT